jgi:16S rRNA (adenine1518-N6/adenine1519-N6)-dimethyltransferase
LSRQRLGQHFLHNRGILERIACAACPSPAGTVIEIGPGRGALTEMLLNHARRVVAIEVDPSLVSFLRTRFAGEPRLEIVEASVLDTDLRSFGADVVAGNLPYYIASAIIEKTVRLAPPRAVFLVQKEVALRLCAKPGERDYGFLTVRTQAFAEPRHLFDVKPGAFQPPPKVDSTVVSLGPRSEPLPLADSEAFVRFLSRCFRHKRKTLRNNLSDFYGAGAIDALPEAGLRAEALSVERLAQLFGQLERHANSPGRDGAGTPLTI